MFHSPGKYQSNPDLSVTDDRVVNVSQRKRKQPESEMMDAFQLLSSEIRGWRLDMDSKISTICDSISVIKQDLDTLRTTSMEIKSEINSLRTNQVATNDKVRILENKQQDTSKLITELQSSIEFNSAEHNDLKTKVSKLGSTSMPEQVTNTVAMLEHKIESMEQHARDCNLEISNLPEKRGENLLKYLEKIGSVINFTIQQRDVLSIHRVPHANSQTTQPKNIIVKLASRLLRDNILSAYRLAKGVKTDVLDIPGPMHTIYFNEHLTLKNKQLFRLCRDAAKLHKYKYVWIKHATILVRETDTSPSIAIKTEKDIAKIRSKN
ncbi:unnamed protein product [Plutella xylostella]|uniref:(diamondback moth) hypothetical protein n=1 Tax=Plutella xylostella TaxID=51655 RepID=A0A8S4DKC3_PLUXY|nr:unnamed protein product [Plutella xylostella]CAG9110746.1 unnamed protein product [Plutella xylostella]